MAVASCTRPLDASHRGDSGVPNLSATTIAAGMALEESSQRQSSRIQVERA